MYCSECKQEGEKACECEAPIIAEMEATVIQNSDLG